MQNNLKLKKMHWQRHFPLFCYPLEAHHPEIPQHLLKVYCLKIFQRLSKEELLYLQLLMVKMPENLLDKLGVIL